MLCRRRRWNPLKLLLWFLFQQRRARPVGRGKTGKERQFHKLLLLLKVTAEFLQSHRRSHQLEPFVRQTGEEKTQTFVLRRYYASYHSLGYNSALRFGPTHGKGQTP